MAFIDVSSLLQPVHEASPCGPDLEYSPLYLEAARALEGAPDVQYGSLRVAAIEPDWKRVKSATLELLAQSRDVRLAVWLTRALLALHGVMGLADGLALIEGLLARHWEHLHPQLDAADDCDPTARINVLLALDEKNGLVREVGATPVVDSPSHGSIRLRDLDPAEGESRSSEITAAVIDAACDQVAFADLANVRDALERAQSSLGRIDARLTECAGHGRSVALAALEHVLARARLALQMRLARHPTAIASESESARRLASACAAEQREDGARRGAVSGRDDVLLMLDQLCAYYARAEPSSPVPVLLERARKLVGMRFVDAVSELTPAGLEQALHWAGPDRG